MVLIFKVALETYEDIDQSHLFLNHVKKMLEKYLVKDYTYIWIENYRKKWTQEFEIMHTVENDHSNPKPHKDYGSGLEEDMSDAKLNCCVSWDSKLTKDLLTFNWIVLRLTQKLRIAVRSIGINYYYI